MTIVARWSKPSGSTMLLYANGDLRGTVNGVKGTVLINARAPGNDRRTRWTLEDAQRRADEYGFTRDAPEERKPGKPRPDFDPRVDYPERYTDGPI